MQRIIGFLLARAHGQLVTCAYAYTCTVGNLFRLRFRIGQSIPFEFLAYCF